MKSDMINIIIGAAVGFAGGYILKNQQSQKETRNKAGVPFSTLYQEAQKEVQDLKGRLRMEREENESLRTQLQSLKQKLRNQADASDDQLDRYDDLSRRVETLNSEKKLLEEKLQEYKDLYSAAQDEIKCLNKE